MSTTAVESELLQRLRLDAANRAFNEDRADDGVAMLLSLLEDHPTNQAAVLRLHSALLHRNWPVMVTPPLQHEGPICAAEFSPDGTRLVTASDDGTARVWDARTGQALTEPLRHGREVRSARFNPDGTRVVTASRDGTARVWDVQTGQALPEPLRHESWVNSAQFSPDGARLMTGSLDGTARIWDAGTGQALTEPLRHEPGNGTLFFKDRFDGSQVTTETMVHSVQFSPDGTRVVTASVDGTARIWDARTGRALTEPLRHEREVHFAQFSPDGTRVVTASEDGAARIWDVVSDATARVWDVPFNCMDLAQLQSYARFVSRKESSPHPPARALSQSEEILLADAMRQLRHTPSADPVVRWLVADRATRTISPHSDRTVPQHVSLVLDNGTRLEIEALLGYLPMHSGLLTRLATLMVGEEERRSIMPR